MIETYEWSSAALAVIAIDCATAAQRRSVARESRPTDSPAKLAEILPFTQ
jgi:hypothetical protein